MTDQQLIDLVQNKSPEDLSVEELELLSRRLEESPELRAALAERLEMDRILCDALRRVRFSVDQILQRYEQRKPVPRASITSRMPILIGVAAIAIVAGVVAVVVLQAKSRPPVQTVIADGASTPVDSQTAHQPQQPVQPSQLSQLSQLSQPPHLTPPNLALAQTPSVVQKPTEPQPQPVVAPPTPAVVVPAVAVISDTPADMTPAMAQRVYQVVEINDQRMTDDVVNRWLSGVPGVPSEQAMRDQAVELNGVTRLKVDWEAGSVTRLWFRQHPQKFDLHFWNGGQGVTLNYFSDGDTARRCLTAYIATRKDTGPRPATLSLLANDEQRLWRAMSGGVPGYALQMDLRYDRQRGQLIVSSADAPVLSVPMIAAPDEIYLEGHLAINRIESVPAASLQPIVSPFGPAHELTKPAELKWLADRPAGSDLEKRADGSVALVTENTDRLAWAAAMIQRDGIGEIDLQLEGAAPGDGIYLGDAQGKPLYPIGFYTERGESGRLLVERGNLNDPRTDLQTDPHGPAAAFISGKLWVRLLFACGNVKYWISSDGQNWAQSFDQNMVQANGSIQSVGLYAAPGKEHRALVLRSITLRNLPLLSAMAPTDLIRRVPALNLKPDDRYTQWMQAVNACRPADVDAALWTRAAAIHSLSTGEVAYAGPLIVDALVSVAMEQRRPWAEKLRLIDEAALMLPRVDGGEWPRIQRYYDRVAADAIGDGEMRPYTRIARDFERVPLRFTQGVRTTFEPLIRAEIINLAYTGQWQPLYTLCRWVKFQQRVARPNETDLVEWAEALAADGLGDGFRTAANVNSPRNAPWRNPMVPEISKEGYSDLLELRAAVNRSAWNDACHVLVKLNTRGGGRGLLPTAGDGQLLVNWPVALDRMMREHPELCDTLRKDFAAEARLRVRQAIESADPEAVEAESLHYYGTDESAEAQAWLGEAAILEGEPARAAGHYRRALRMTSGPNRDRIEAGLRLANAMLGQTATAGSVESQFASARISAAELDSLRQQHATNGGVASPVTTIAAAPAPASASFDAVARARYEGEVGENNGPPDASPVRSDFVARQIALAVYGNQLLLSNRFQVASYDLGPGTLKWRTELSRDESRGQFPGKMFAWPGAAARPIIAGGRIFVRRLQRVNGQDGRDTAATLACMERANGNVIWSNAADPINMILTDPILIQDRIYVVSAKNIDGREWTLMLATYDPQSGALISQKQLMSMRESGANLLTVQIAAIEDGFVITAMGTVMAIDVAGDIRWTRQEMTLPPRVDHGWVSQGQDAPIVDGDHCFIAQPGTRTILCIDNASGELKWRRIVPAILKVIGLVDQRLIIRTEDGFVALNPADGRQLWASVAENVLCADLCGGPGGLLYVSGERIENNQFRPTFVWLDLATGIEKARTPLDALKHQGPRFGPMVTAGNRLFALASAGRDNEFAPNRDLVEFVPRGAAPVIRGPATEMEIWTRRIEH